MGVSSALIYVIMPYLAVLALALGLGWRLWRWLSAPAALSEVLTPASAGAGGAGGMLLWHGAMMPRLAWARPRLWLLVWPLHLCLLLLILSHLRLLPGPLARWLGPLAGPEPWAGWLLVALLTALLSWRLAGPVFALHSRWGDYLALLLLLAVAGSGLFLAQAANTDLIAVRAWARGLLLLAPAPPSAPGWALGLHLLLAWALLASLPFTRLAHGLAILLSPLLARGVDPRSAGAANPWDGAYAGDAPSTKAVREDEPPLYTLERYRARLRRRWTRGGTGRVLSACDRAAAGSMADEP